MVCVSVGNHAKGDGMKIIRKGPDWWRDMAALKHRSEHPRNGRTDATTQDRIEILEYICENEPCSRFDIELCCFQSRNAVLTHLAALKKSGHIKTVQRGYGVNRLQHVEIHKRKMHTSRDEAGRFMRNVP